jgi:hypothetical protein
VAVVTRERIAIASGVRDIEQATPDGDGSGGRILRGTAIASRAAGSRIKRVWLMAQSPHLIATMPINLLKSQAYWREANSTSRQNALQLAIPPTNL